MELIGIPDLIAAGQALLGELNTIKTLKKENETVVKDIDEFMQSLEAGLQLVQTRGQTLQQDQYWAFESLTKDLKKASTYLKGCRTRGGIEAYWDARRIRTELTTLRNRLSHNFVAKLFFVTFEVIIDKDKRTDEFHASLLKQLTDKATRSDIESSTREVKNLLKPVIRGMKVHEGTIDRLRTEIRALSELLESALDTERFLQDILASLAASIASDREDEEQYYDPYTSELMCDPVKCHDGKTYDRFSVFQNNETMPNNPLTIVCPDEDVRIRVFDKFSHRQPDKIMRSMRDAYRTKALALANANDVGEALVRIDNVLQWDPDDSLCRDERERIGNLYREKALNLAENGDCKDARHMLETVLKWSPSDRAVLDKLDTIQQPVLTPVPKPPMGDQRCSQAMDHNMNRMEAEMKKSLDDDGIRRQFEKLLLLGENDWKSEQLSGLRGAIEGRETLNLNGLFRDYTKIDRQRALTLVFRLVDGTSVQALLLEDNNIDGASLGLSLQKFIADERHTRLSNIRTLALGRNIIGRERDVYSMDTPGHPKDRSLLNENSLLNEIFLLDDQLQDKSALIEDAFRVGVFPFLRSFSLSENEMETTFSKRLISSWQGNPITGFLEEIDLSGNDLKAEAIEALCNINWSQLRRLALARTGIMDFHCTFIADAIQAGRLEALESIDLSGNFIDDDAMNALASSFRKNSLLKLREINLRGNFIGDSGVTAIAQAIITGGLQLLENIDLSCNRLITDSSMVFLAASFRTGQVNHLKTLNFSGMNLESAGVIGLAHAIGSSSLKSLETLDLSHITKITDSALVDLAVALGTGHVAKLRELHLGSIGGWGNDSIIKLAEAIHSGNLRLLETLDISHAYDYKGKLPSERAMASLADSVGTGHMTHMKRLLFQETGLGDEGVVKLAEAMGSGNLRSLEELDLSYNRNVHDKSAKSLPASLDTGHMPHMKKICLAGTPAYDGRDFLMLAHTKRRGDFKIFDTLDPLSPYPLNYLREVYHQTRTEGSKDQSASSMLKRDVSQDPRFTLESMVGGCSSKGEDERSLKRKKEKVFVEGPEERRPRSPKRMMVSVFGHHLARMDHQTRTVEDKEEEEVDENKDEGQYEDREEGKKSMSKTSVNDRSQIRSDFQCLGFTSWDCKFDPSRVLALGDVTNVEEQVHFIFFHVKGMASLFGIELQFSKVSISLGKGEILIEEMLEESWKNFWKASYMGPFKPFLFERIKTERQGNHKSLGTDVFQLNKSEALSKFGVSIDGSQLHEFVKLGVTMSTGRGRTIKWEPSWISWIKGVINHMVPDGMATHGLQEKMQVLAVGTLQGTAPSVNYNEAFMSQTSQDAKPKLEVEVGAPIEQEKALVVKVIFVQPACPFFNHNTNGEAGEKIEAGDKVLFGWKSLIQPTLTVKFFRDQEQNLVTTTLAVRYEMGKRGKREDWPAGWFQDNLQLCFGSSDEDGSQYRQYSRTISEVESIQAESTVQYGMLTSSQHGGGLEGSIQGGFLSWASANAKVCGQQGSTNQSTQSDQSKYTSTQDVLKHHSSFGIRDQSVGSIMEYEASFWPAQNPSKYFHINWWKNAKDSGLQSNVGIEVEATWDLFGEETHQYVLEASKKLSKCTSIGSRIDGAQPKIENSCGESSTSSSKPEDQNVVGFDVMQKIILQIFSKKLNLNHNFSEIFQEYKQQSYQWKLIHHNSKSPIPRALDMA